MVTLRWHVKLSCSGECYQGDKGIQLGLIRDWQLLIGSLNVFVNGVQFLLPAWLSIFIPADKPEIRNFCIH